MERGIVRCRSSVARRGQRIHSIATVSTANQQHRLGDGRSRSSHEAGLHAQPWRPEVPRVLSWRSYTPNLEKKQRQPGSVASKRPKKKAATPIQSKSCTNECIAKATAYVHTNPSENNLSGPVLARIRLPILPWLITEFKLCYSNSRSHNT